MSTNEKFQTAPHEAKMVWCSAQRTRVNPLDGTLLEDVLLFAGDVEKTGYPPQFVRISFEYVPGRACLVLFFCPPLVLPPLLSPSTILESKSLKGLCCPHPES